MIDLEKIRIDGGTQSRVELNQSVIEEYAETMKAGENLPPVLVFNDGATYWLADGFHRFFAAKKAGRAQIDAEERPGTQRDAILASLSANSKHGLKRSNADKHKAVRTLLNDAEWRQWSNREIAKAAAVSHFMVNELRDMKNSVTGISSSDNNLTSDIRSDNDRKYTTKHGTEAVMNTANIGKHKKPSQLDALRERQGQEAHPDFTEEGFGAGLSDAEKAFAELEAQADQARIAILLEENTALAEMTKRCEAADKDRNLLQTRFDSLLNEKAEAIRFAKRYETMNRKLTTENAALKKENEALKARIVELESDEIVIE
ncbi:MAG: ParB/RepB/Spo0J family partition protein [Zoogloeaceae bacterium]|jgi:hypothetical protein|nr:ParB/RepB/Spo0J family partition protein [Zoogloeaceae bacterium]